MSPTECLAIEQKQPEIITTSLQPNLSNSNLVENKPELQREYIDIYIERVIYGKSMMEVANSRHIGGEKVRLAMKWCRSQSEEYVWIEALADAINAINYRMGKLVTTQEKLRIDLANKEESLTVTEQSLMPGLAKEEKDRLIDNRRDYKNSIAELHRLILDYEDKIQMTLDKKFNLQNLYQKHVIEIRPENMQMNNINTFTNNVKEASLSIEDRNAIADILERTYRRKIQ